MKKVRVIYKPDNTIAIIHPAPKSRRYDESEVAWYNRVFSDAMNRDPNLTGLPYDDIPITKLPKSREARNAWEKDSTGGIKVNKTKAKRIATENRKKILIAEEKEKILDQQAIDSLKSKGLL